MWARLRRSPKLVIACALLIALGATWALKAWKIAGVEANITQRQSTAVLDASAVIRTEFERLQQDILEDARRVAEDQHVQDAVRLSDGEPSEFLLNHLDELNLEQRTSIAIYTSDMDLVGWSGEDIPMSLENDVSQIQWRIARDDSWRDALVLWHPINNSNEVIGTIRLTHLLYERVPVQNESLRNYSITDQWSRQVELPVAISADSSAETADVLTALSGERLAFVSITPPTTAGLVEQAARPFDNWLALWCVGLIIWGITVLWKWHDRRSTLPRLAAVSAAVFTGRFLLLWLDVPARYQTGKAPLSPLFDPVHLASTLGSGVMRSSGDFLLTSLCGLLIAGALFGHAMRQNPDLQRTRNRDSAWVLRMVAAAVMQVGLTCVLAAAVHASVIDSTLSYVARSQLLPVPLEVVVFSAVAVCSLAILVASAAFLRFANGGYQLSVSWHLAIPGVVAALIIGTASQLGWCPWYISSAYLIVGGLLGVRLNADRFQSWLSVRKILLAVLVVCLLVYPLFYRGIDQRKQEQIAYAAASFDTGDEPGIAFAIREVVEEALRSSDLAVPLLAQSDLDSVANSLLQGSLLSSLGAYDASVAFLDADGSLLHVSGAAASVTHAAVIDSLYGLLEPEQRQYEGTYSFIEPSITGPNRLHYAGLGSIGVPVRRWILVQARPHIVLEEANTPLLRLLLSTGYRHEHTGLSLAAYRNGLLVRSTGRSFGQYRLDSGAAAELAGQSEFWRKEDINGRQYDTYYRQVGGEVLAARVRIIGLTDHLYFLLRLMSGALIAGVLVLLVGLVWRWRAGLLPAARVRFSDRVLNAFLIVGVIAVIPVGIAGVGVITEENEKAVQSWLRQHLQRIEATLESEADPGESILSVLNRISIDGLAARSGLDLNLYQDHQLVAASRPQLVADRIIDTRLPASVYKALYFDADQFTFVEHKLGDFAYTAGYRAILDEGGQPRYVLSVPTLPEAERIEEERARTLAYLFGALLALGITVLLIALVLARALAYPIAKLQRGLQGVAEGRFEHLEAVRTRDEVGDLVRTFNNMQGQLNQSQQKLAQQERQLAWREMARQVAHEIKNPLTPMKLSVQHLRRAGEAADGFDARFRQLFERVTRTLVDQINSLAHIANEFASLARLHSPEVARLDLTEVIEEAHALMMEQVPSHVQLDLEMPDKACYVQADRNALRRIYINLIKNALEALQDDSRGFVTITAIQDGNMVTTTVTDTGHGIPEALKPRIFEPNFSTKTSGAGLGLAIARQSAETMGGSMDFDSTAGQGTSMRVHLPLYVG